MISDTDGILIEKYLDGALEGQALSDFENRLLKEKALAENLADRRSFHRFLQNQSQREKLEQTSSSIAEKHFEKTVTIRPLWRRTAFRLTSAAAAIALLLLLWQPWKPSALYDQYAQHKTLALAERGNESISTFDIENTFDQKKYTQTIPLLQSYLTTYPEATEASFYLGICYLELDQFQQSDAIFQTLYAGETSFKYQALWYLSLSALKQNKRELTKQYLLLLPEDSDRYIQAQKLLKEL